MKWKKNKSAWILVVLLVIFVSFFALTPSLVDSIVAIATGNPQSCDITPYDGNCVCPGQQKVLIEMLPLEYECRPIIELPPSYTIPITTWEEALAYTEEQMGGTIICSGDQFYKEGYYTGPIQQFDRIDLVSIDCSIALGPNAGQSTWRFLFDPHDGHIYQRWCNQDAVMEGMTCPADIPFTPKS